MVASPEIILLVAFLMGARASQPCRLAGIDFTAPLRMGPSHDGWDGIVTLNCL